MPGHRLSDDRQLLLRKAATIKRLKTQEFLASFGQLASILIQLYTTFRCRLHFSGTDSSAARTLHVSLSFPLERDLFIAASNGHLLAFDNLSDLPPWMSDSLCRLASGGSFAVRQLEKRAATYHRPPP
jgi:hypothetical protein